VVLRRDLAPRAKACAHEVCAKRVARFGIGREQEVVVTPTVNPHEGKHTRLRSQEQRVACIAGRERFDVVRQQPLQEVLGVRTRDADERALATDVASGRQTLHASSLGTRCHSSARKPKTRSVPPATTRRGFHRAST
jgi:hypothetical protein